MLAKIENGCLLQIDVNEEDNEYMYIVFSEVGEELDCGYTEYRSIEMYHPLDEIGYICEFCDPEYVDGDYMILSENSPEEYIEKSK